MVTCTDRRQEPTLISISTGIATALGDSEIGTTAKESRASSISFEDCLDAVGNGIGGFARLRAAKPDQLKVAVNIDLREPLDAGRHQLPRLVAAHL